VEEEGGREEGEGRGLAVANHTGTGIRRGFLLEPGGGLIAAGELPAGGRTVLSRPFPLVDAAAKPEAQGEADPFGGDLLLREVVEILQRAAASPAGRGWGFIGVLERGEGGLVVDRPSSLDRRLDLLVVSR
jgi:hypothetical protein